MVSYGIRYEAQTHLGDNVNLSPRASFAWTPFKSGSTTVRGGFGVFNDWYEDSLYEQALRLDGVRQRDLIVRNPTYPSVDLTGAAASTPSVTRVASDLVMPQITRASFGVEHAFASWAQFRSNYFIQRTSDEFRAVNLNAKVNGVVPFPTLGIITYVDAIGEAKSQGIDLSMNLNYAPKRIFGTINYRLAKAMNDGDSATSLPMNGGDLDGRMGRGARRRAAPHLRLRLGAAEVRPALEPEHALRVGHAVQHHHRLRRQRGQRPQRSTDRRRPQQRPRRRPAQRRPAPELAEERRTAEGRRPGSRRAGRRAGHRSRPWRPGSVAVAAADRVAVVVGLAAASGPGGNAGRVNFEVFAQVSNLTNTVNYRSYSGVVASRWFGQALSSAEPRRVELGMRVGF